MKVFLGGTCAGSTWRDKLIPLLKCDYYNPVTKDWNEEARRMEELAKASSRYHLYVITNRQHGYYTIAELVHAAMTAPYSVIFAVIAEDDSQVLFTPHQLKSLEQIEKMVGGLGVKICHSLEEIAEYLNTEHLAKYQLCIRFDGVLYRSEPMPIEEVEEKKRDSYLNCWVERVKE